MDAESAIVILLGVVVFLSFHFSLLSFYTIDNAHKVEFVLLAASATIAGVILFAILMIYFVIKRFFHARTIDWQFWMSLQPVRLRNNRQLALVFEQD